MSNFKRSANIIVSNGQPFVVPQLKNIYNHVDEIIIVEGADWVFSDIIGSIRSTDGTLEAIRNFPDPDKKIKLILTDQGKDGAKNTGGKNKMVARANQESTGDVIYSVDIDEFIDEDDIERCFKAFENDRVTALNIPQRWYYKWTDTYIASNRPDQSWWAPIRFMRNAIKSGAVISHIPPSGYVKDGKLTNVAGDTFDGLCHHYLAVTRLQLVNKGKYYAKRGDASAEKMAGRLKEWDSKTRKDIGRPVVTYHKAILTKLNSPPSHLDPSIGGK